MTTTDDLSECWCCESLHDTAHLRCPACKDAGCDHFGDGCGADHTPVLTDGGTLEDATGRWDDRIATEGEIYDRARQHWGTDAQLAKLAEEAAELSAVASRAINGQAEPDAFLEELVDTRIMLQQFARTYRTDRIESTVDDRVDRLERLLEGVDDA